MVQLSGKPDVSNLRIDDSSQSASACLTFSFLFEGLPVLAQQGDTIGAALWAQETKTFRHSPNGGTPRGMFCAMGVCQECVVRVDGRVSTACNTLAKPDMDVRMFSLNQGDQAK